MPSQVLSILYTEQTLNNKANTVSETTCHDLGLDNICKALSDKENEQRMIMNILAKMYPDAELANYRAEIFNDILKNPSIRTRMIKLLDKIQFIRDFGSFKRDHDKKAGIWDLLHRLEEINDYIECVEAIRECLSDSGITAKGLLNLKASIDAIYENSHFAAMKNDIANLKADTTSLKSITVGININERFEATQIGVISVNNKPFKHSNILNNFSKALTSKNGVKDGNDWNGDMSYTPVEDGSSAGLEKLEKMAGFMAVTKTPFVENSVRSTVVNMPDGDANADITHYMNKIVDQMLSTTVKKLRDVLSKYVNVSMMAMTELIPEFVYYIRFAEFIEKCMKKGMVFSQAKATANSLKVNSAEDMSTMAKGFYNLKLALGEHSEEIVKNDLSFDNEHTVYILTGANRGGKTTVTQAIGLLYVLAQGGINVPADSFEYTPVDNIFSHFPADEDKTMDLGRLGEECTRFKEIYKEATENSLLLLNETFSTTSFEEGYYIARDCVKAILSKGIKTIYNTHMHKLAYDISAINSEIVSDNKAASLIVKSKDGQRSFKIEVAEPEGMSYANDIASKYGVTFEMLTNK